MKRLAVLMMVLSTTLHAAPDEVLTSNFAREEGWQWYNPNAAEEDPAPAPAPTQQARLASMTPSEQKSAPAGDA